MQNEIDQNKDSWKQSFDKDTLKLKNQQKDNVRKNPNDKVNLLKVVKGAKGGLAGVAKSAGKELLNKKGKEILKKQILKKLLPYLLAALPYIAIGIAIIFVILVFVIIM